MLRCWLRPTKPQTASTPSSAAASNTRSMNSCFFLPHRRIVVQQVVEIPDVRQADAGRRSARSRRGARDPCRTACADRACSRPDRASPRAARRSRWDAARPTAGCSRRPARRANASQSSIARSGSGSRTARGVSSCSAAVSTPTFMNFGSNGRGRHAQHPTLVARRVRSERDHHRETEQRRLNGDCGGFDGPGLRSRPTSAIGWIVKTNTSEFVGCSFSRSIRLRRVASRRPSNPHGPVQSP